MFKINTVINYIFIFAYYFNRISKLSIKYNNKHNIYLSLYNIK